MFKVIIYGVFVMVVVISFTFIADQVVVEGWLPGEFGEEVIGTIFLEKLVSPHL